jgi:hypothetical protein
MKTSEHLTVTLNETTANAIRLKFDLSTLPPELSRLWEEASTEHSEPVHLLPGETYYISIAAASPNCRAGRFIATLVAVHPCDERKRDKTWPRYYFNRDRAKREAEEWMMFNGQFHLLCLGTTPSNHS